MFLKPVVFSPIKESVALRNGLEGTRVVVLYKVTFTSSWSEQRSGLSSEGSHHLVYSLAEYY